MQSVETPMARRATNAGSGSGSGSARKIQLARASSSFLIRPSPAARKDAEAQRDEATRTRALCAEEIEREFLEIDVLTEDKLRALAGQEDLESVKALTLRVDTTDQSISQLGHMLPALRELTLNRSVLASFRDFGTSLRRLQVLNLAASQVRDLDGISALDALQELRVPGNYIRCLTPLAMHEHLRVLDARANLVCDLNEIDQLGTCLALSSLLLEENPVAKIEPYRRVVVQYIPHLRILDDHPVSPADREPVGDNVIENLSAFLETVEAGVCGPDDDDDTGEDGQDGDVDHSTDTAGARWASLCRGSLPCGSEEPELICARPSTPRAGSGSKRSAHSPKDAPSRSKLASDRGSNDTRADSVRASAGHSEESASDLTHGSTVVFAGNLAASMRRRKKASQLELNQQRLRQVAASLESENWGLEGPEDDLTPRFGSGADPDDALLSDSKLDELLALSDGLERDFRELQLHQAPAHSKTESPRSRIARRKPSVKPSQQALAQSYGKQPRPPAKRFPVSSTAPLASEDGAHFAPDLTIEEEKVR